jgi:hypothetical protein
MITVVGVTIAIPTEQHRLCGLRLLRRNQARVAIERINYPYPDDLTLTK